MITEDKESEPLIANSAKKTGGLGEKQSGDDRAKEKLKDPHYKQRLITFLEEKAALFDDVFEAQSLRNSKTSQLEIIEVPEEVKALSSSYSLNDKKIYFSDRLNMLLIARVSAN